MWKSQTEELHRNINIALYSLTFKCKENPEKKNVVSEDYPSNILTTYTSAAGKNGSKTVKMFKENHKNTKIKNRCSTYSYCYMTEAFQYS